MTPSQSKMKTSISFSNCEFGSVNLSTLARRTVLVWKLLLLLLLLVGVQNTGGGETLLGGPRCMERSTFGENADAHETAKQVLATSRVNLIISVYIYIYIDMKDQTHLSYCDNKCHIPTGKTTYVRSTVIHVLIRV
jgi:hypothetical protein